MVCGSIDCPRYLNCAYAMAHNHKPYEEVIDWASRASLVCSLITNEISKRYVCGPDGNYKHFWPKGAYPQFGNIE